MKIKVNGKEQSIEVNPILLLDLIKQNNVKQPDMVSVQLNGDFVQRGDFDHTVIKEGDVVEFLYFMGGGQDEKKKLSIISFSGDFDKLVAAFTLASGSAAVGYEVNIFFTFWGLNAIKKERGRKALGKGFLAKFFGYLQGGRNNVPLSRLNFAGISPKLMTYMMRKRNVATLDELIDASIALNVNLYACEMSGVILGLEKETYIPEIKEILGVAKFLDISEGGRTLFI
jgi:thiamine biosynthesis protein ThiS